MAYAPIKRLAIFLPTTNALYIVMLFALKRAFKQLNIEVFGWTELLNERDLMNFVRQFKPDAIMEMNRSRQQVPFLPKEIKHISWMVDVADWPYKKISGSEIIYFFGANWFNHYPKKSNSLVRWLPPGACPDLYYWEEHPPLSDISFIGHVPRPWSKEELSRPVFSGVDQTLTFGQLYEACLRRWQNTDLKNFDNETYMRSASSLASEIAGVTVQIEDRKLRYDLSCRTVRLMNRERIIRLALRASTSMQIFGSPNWECYPEFSQYYQKFLDDPNEIRHVYQSVKINLHEGVGLHCRTFDCMASGGCLFYYRSPDDDSFGGINTFFDPGFHYVAFDEKDYSAQAERYLCDDVLRKKICRQAAHIIKEKHTWKHRAAQIVEDLREC